MTEPQTRWPGLLIGTDQIRAYLDHISLDTLHRWRKLYRLPIAHMPNGVLFSSTAVLDQWLAQAIAAELADGMDRKGWSNYQHGCYSGLRLAHDTDGYNRARALAGKRTR